MWGIFLVLTSMELTMKKTDDPVIQNLAAHMAQYAMSKGQGKKGLVEQS